MMRKGKELPINYDVSYRLFASLRERYAASLTIEARWGVLRSWTGKKAGRPPPTSSHDATIGAATTAVSTP